MGTPKLWLGASGTAVAIGAALLNVVTCAPTSRLSARQEDNSTRLQFRVRLSGVAEPPFNSAANHMRWNVGPDMFLKLDEVASAIVGNYMYTFGGFNDDTMVLDLDYLSWSEKAKRPLYGNHHGIAVLDRGSGPEIFLVGGFGGGSGGAVQIYNVGADSWTVGAPLGYSVDGSICVAALYGTIIACGGLHLKNIHNPRNCQMLDVASGIWVNKASMLQGVDHAAVGVSGNNMYVFGGRSSGMNAPGPGLDVVQKYNAQMDTWTYAQSMPFGRGGMGSAPFVNGHFFVMGGETSGGVYSEVYMFDGSTWTKTKDMIKAKHGIYPVFDSTQNRLIVAGGGNVAGFSATSSLEIFYLSAPIYPNRPSYLTMSQQSCPQLGWHITDKQGAHWACSDATACSAVEMTHAQAETECNNMNARLCTSLELAADVTRQGGCSLERKLIWTAESCSGGFYAAGATSRYQGSPTRVCQTSASIYPYRCCADASTDPIPVSTRYPTETTQTTVESSSASVGILNPDAYSQKNCSDLGWTMHKRTQIYTVCATSIFANDICRNSLSHSDAKAQCEVVGARLCTALELQYDVGIGSGCNLDRNRIWTSSDCQTDTGETGYYAFAASTKFESSPTNPSAQCHVETDLVKFRCCADVSIPDISGVATMKDTTVSLPETSAEDTTEATESTEDADTSPAVNIPTQSSVQYSASSCNQLGWTLHKKQRLTSVCAHGMDCPGSLTFNDADALCSAANARLCTVMELRFDAAIGRGCQLDRSLIWTSSPCITPSGAAGIYTAAASTKFDVEHPSSPTSICRETTELAATRCCADLVIPEDTMTFVKTSTTMGEEATSASPVTQDSTTVILVDSTDSTQLASTMSSQSQEGLVSSLSCEELQWGISRYQRITTACSNIPTDEAGDDICWGPLTHDSAQAQCGSIGARLCTALEIDYDVSYGQGCKLDRKMTWSSSTCTTSGGVPGFIAVAGSSKFSIKNPSSPTRECRKATQLTAVRCCADMRSSSVDTTESDIDFAGPVNPDPFQDFSHANGVMVPLQPTWRYGTGSLGWEMLEPQGIAVGGRLWLIGGFSNGNYKQMAKQTLSYNPNTDSWSRHADMPLPGGITHAAQATDGEYIYIVGGMATASDQVEFPNCQSVDVTLRYTIADDVWVNLPPLPLARAGGGAAVLDGLLHFVGGGTFVPNVFFTVDHVDHWVLDISNPWAGWQPRKPIKLARNHMGVVASAGYIYALGGQFLEGEYHDNQDRVERYDPATDEWTDVAPMLENMGHITPGVFNTPNGFFVLGGFANGRYRNAYSLFFYSPTLNKWYRLSAMEPGPSQVAGIIGDTIYAQIRDRLYKGRVDWTSAI